MRTPTDSFGNISPNKPISETSAIGRYVGFKMSWTTGQEKHLATKRQVFYSWIWSNRRYLSVALEIRIQGRLKTFQTTFAGIYNCNDTFVWIKFRLSEMDCRFIDIMVFYSKLQVEYLFSILLLLWKIIGKQILL